MGIYKRYAVLLYLLGYGYKKVFENTRFDIITSIFKTFIVKYLIFLY